MMPVSPETEAELTALEAFAQGHLTRRMDLGTLMDLARRNDRKSLLEDLSFHAKFLHRAYGIMKRIGKDADGYDKLSAEFNANIEKSLELLRGLVAAAPADVGARFQHDYLAMTPVAFEALMGLFYDLSWYKNWLIDHHRENT